MYQLYIFPRGAGANDIPHVAQFLLHFKQALLVAGGRDSSNDLLSSTELYLPSTNGWIRKANLPRQHKFKLL